MKGKHRALFLAAMLLWTVSVLADVSRYDIPLDENRNVSVMLPSTPRGSLAYEERLYVALGTHGLAVFQLEGNSARFLEIRNYEGEVSDVTLVNGLPWVVLHRLSAQPLFDQVRAEAPVGSLSSTGSGEGKGQVGAVASDASSQPEPPTPTATGGKVLSYGSGSVIIDQGLDDGLSAGDHLRFLTRIEVEASELGLSGDDTVFREVESGTGRIETIASNRSKVLLNRGSSTKSGDRVERYPYGVRSKLLPPPRLGGITELVATIRPFLAVGTLGVGTINDARLTYVAPQPYFVQIELQPLTAGWSEPGNLVSASVLAMAGYDHQLFGVGLGAGYTAANTGVTEFGTEYDYGDAMAEDRGYSMSFENVKRGFSLGQCARLGSRDGLHIELRNTFVLSKVEVFEAEYAYDDETGEEVQSDPVKVDEYKEFRWGATRGRIVLPVARVTDLLFDVGGGANGYLNLEGGIQSWIRGNGDAGSLGISVAAGFGMLSGTIDDESVDLLGPLISFGVRKRW